MKLAEYTARKEAGQPIESARELVHALRELQLARTQENTDPWFLLNRYMRHAMGEADRRTR